MDRNRDALGLHQRLIAHQHALAADGGMDTASRRRAKMLGSAMDRPEACACATMVLPSGCSERNSAAAAASRTASAVTPATGRIARTAGVPKVSVPVLSRTIVVTLPSSSRYRPP